MRVTQVLVSLVVLGVASALPRLPWLDNLGEDLAKYGVSGKMGPSLATAVDMLSLKAPIVGKSKIPLENKLFALVDQEERGLVTCSLCRTFADAVFGWIEQGLSEEELINRATALCVSLGVTTERVCRGAIEINADVVRYIVDSKNGTSEELTSAQICGFALYPECNFDGTNFEWTLDLDFLGPKPTPEVPQLPPEGSPTLKIIQFTDVHIDPNYVPGNNAECGEPMCCRADQGVAPEPSAAAGFWGDYRDCDFPPHAYTDMLEQAASRHQDVAYVIFTGDIVDHSVWATSEQYNTDLITFMNDQLVQYFPGVPVIPTFGNHEAHPCNVFADPFHTEIPENLKTTWLYQLMADLWSVWLPPSTRPDIMNGGRFAVDVSPNLKVISINTMWCYSLNWWLMYDNMDPAGQLTWLANQLLAAEQAGQKVHILAHHPTGASDCMHFWSSQYQRIVDRFENTLVAQFHGHTHDDHFNIYYDLADSSRATSVSFTAGSGTPYSDINPNYRVYTIGSNIPGSAYRVLDHESWYYNLTEANLAGAAMPPNWIRLYSFNEAYNTTSLFPQELDTLVQRMANDPVLQDQYWRFYVKNGDAALAAGCGTRCLENLVCEILVTVTGDESKCTEYLP